VEVVVLATVFTPKPNMGFGVESVDVLVLVTEAVVEVVVVKPVKTGAIVAAVVTEVAVCLKEKGVKDREVGGPMLPKMGLKVGVVVLVVVGRVELEEAGVVAEGLEGRELLLSLLGGTRKMGLNMGEAEDTPGAAGEEEAAGEEGRGGWLLGIPNTMLGLGVGARAGGSWVLSDVSVCSVGGDLVSVTVVMEEAGASPRKVSVDFESEEVPGRGAGSEEPRGAGRLGVFGGEGAEEVATSADSGRRKRKVSPADFHTMVLSMGVLYGSYLDRPHSQSKDAPCLLAQLHGEL
jgi:hypothetical protein